MKAGALVGGKYLLVKPLGRGAMGEVWQAINRSTDGEVALKLLMPGADPEVRRRLLREAKACGRLRHRTIVEIYDVGETDGGEPFLVMQLLHGETLAQLLKRMRKLPVDVAVGIACDVAIALRHAHERNIVHRDLKPANIFLHQEADTEGTQTKVVDFGVSKLAIENEGESAGTMAGSLLGSPAYMSPEQARAAPVDGRSDLWALGVLLFEMLAGKRPFRGQSAIEVIGELHSKRPIVRVETMAPHVNARLGDVIAACLTRAVDERVASAAELLRLLRPFGPREQFGTNQSGQHNLFSSSPDARELPSSPAYAAPPAPAVQAPALPPPAVMPPAAPAQPAPRPRIAPPPVAAAARESVTGLFQPQMMPVPHKEEISSDSMDETIMRPAPGLKAAAPIAPIAPIAARSPAPRAPAPEPEEPSRDSMEAATGMFNPRALIAPLYEERESQEPTGRLGSDALAVLEARAVPYTVSESSRPTAELVRPAPRAAPTPARPVESPSRTAPVPHISPRAQNPMSGTLPMQPAFLPQSRDRSPDDDDRPDWERRPVPIEPPPPPEREAGSWKKLTVPLDAAAPPMSPSAPDWRKQANLAWNPQSSPHQPNIATAQWAPLPGTGSATSTSPVSRGGGPPLPSSPSLDQSAELEPPKTSNPLMLVLIACSIVFVLSSLAIVVVTIRRDKPPASAASSASAPSSASAALSAKAVAPGSSTGSKR